MAVAITQTANPAGVDHSANVTTYSGASVGTAAYDRLIAVLIGKEVATVVANSATVGGIPAILGAGATFGNMGAWAYLVSYPAGTTADIAVTWSGAITAAQNHIAVYAITGAAWAPAAGSDTSTDMDATDPLTTGSTVISTDGGMLAVAVGTQDTNAKTWANLTEDIDADVGDFRFTTASSITAGTATRTCTGVTNLEDGVLAYLNFEVLVDPRRQPTNRSFAVARAARY